MNVEQHEYFTLTYDDSQEAKDRLFAIMLKWFKKLNHYCGDSLNQSDSTYVEAPNILTEAAEEAFRFEKKYNDEP